MKTYTEYDVLAELRKRIEATSQAEFADEHGFSRSFVNDVLHDRRTITKNLAGLLGFDKQPDAYIRKAK